MSGRPKIVTHGAFKMLPGWAPGQAAFLYVVRSGDYLKVGRAKNCEQRLIDLQIGNPRKLELAHVEAVAESYAPWAEGAAHNRLAGRAVRGEWFSGPFRSVRRVVREVSREANAQYWLACAERPAPARREAADRGGCPR